MSNVEWPSEYERILREHLLDLDASHEVTVDLVLTDYGLDSIGIVNLMVALEDGFGITFPDELLVTGTFSTAGTLWAVVREVTVGAEHAAAEDARS